MTQGRPLSGKQETFCAFLANGDSQTDSYLKSYNTKKMTRKMASTEASKLMSNDKIRERVEQLRADAHIKKDVATRQDREWIIREATAIVKDDDARDSDKLRALEILSKLKGLYEETTEAAIEHRSSEELKAELKEKLSKFLGG